MKKRPRVKVQEESPERFVSKQIMEAKEQLKEKEVKKEHESESSFRKRSKRLKVKKMIRNENCEIMRAQTM